MAHCSSNPGGKPNILITRFSPQVGLEIHDHSWPYHSGLYHSRQPYYSLFAWICFLHQHTNLSNSSYVGFHFALLDFCWWYDTFCTSSCHLHAQQSKSATLFIYVIYDFFMCDNFTNTGGHHSYEIFPCATILLTLRVTTAMRYFHVW